MIYFLIKLNPKSFTNKINHNFTVQLKDKDDYNIKFENAMNLYNLIYEIKSFKFNKLLNEIRFWKGIFNNYKKSFDETKNLRTRNEFVYYYDDPTYKIFNDTHFKYIFNTIYDIYIKIYENTGFLEKNSNEYIMDNYNTVFFQKLIIKDKNPSIFFIGDIHSSFHSILFLILELIYKDKTPFEEKSLKLKEGNYIIFTGDLVDRGPYSLEVLAFVLVLKINNPNNVIIIKGNHENYSTYSEYYSAQAGTSQEASYQLDDDTIKKNIKVILKLFPVVLFIKFDDIWYQACHGAIDFDYTGYNRYSKEFDLDKSDVHNFLNSHEYKNKDFYKPVLKEKYINQFQWGDFVPYGNDEIGEDSGRLKLRSDTLRKYLNSHKIKTIISGHQDAVPFALVPNHIDSEYIDHKKSAYDGLYEIDCHKTKLKTNGNCRFRYEFTNDKRTFLACTLSTAVISKPDLNKYHSYGVLRHNI